MEKNNNKYNFFNSSDKWIVILNHIHGYKCREISLQNIVSTLNCNVVCLNETLLKGTAKLDIPGFSSYAKNRVDKNGGGISTSI